MTREEIFSKDVITIDELGYLLGLSYQLAAQKLREIKRVTDRTRIQGKIHIQDYFDYFKVNSKDYVNKKEESAMPKNKYIVSINGGDRFVFDNYDQAKFKFDLCKSGCCLIDFTNWELLESK